jgi:hypothetical protein
MNGMDGTRQVAPELREAVETVNRRELSLKRAALSLSVGVPRFKEMAAEAGLALIVRDVGRPSLDIGPEQVQAIFDYRERLRVGYQRAADVLGQGGDSSVTEWGARTAYEHLDLYTYRRPPQPPNLHENRFVARYT